jgi:hypothetical protein
MEKIKKIIKAGCINFSSLSFGEVMNGRSFFYFISLVALLTGCTEDVDLSVVAGEKKVVIEGSIENGKPATVIITRNSPLSQSIDVNTILVTDAKVYIFDGVMVDTLHLAIDSFSSFPLVYKGSAIIGAVNQTYHLTVIADGKTFTSVTTIPPLVELDSVWWKEQPPRDSLGYAWAHFTEPAGYGNAYRWYAKRGTKDNRFIAPYAATFDDKFIDGKSFDFAYNRGTDPNDKASAPPDKLEEGYFKKSDTVYIKFCTIDYNTARFYTTYEAALQTNGNPFASPATIISNINGGALGVWGGFGATYDTIMPTP